MTPNGERLYLVLISIHGLIRGQDLELGRDPDTGGQTRYVVDLARALAKLNEVARVDLLTRQIIDPKVSADYARPIEQIAPKAFIVRLPAGPRRYLRKEVLWPYLDSFTDAALQHLRRVGRLPDWIHSHYADAGYVGARLAALLSVPLIHTGHSLGRVKRQRLLEQGSSEESIEDQYNMTERIEAEEVTLDSAALVIASTHQEIEEQYRLYDNHHPRRMIIVPPGTDLERFHPPVKGEPPPRFASELGRFLSDPEKPIILAMSRADERKNIPALVHAYGGNKALREAANLVLVLGNRDDVLQLDKSPREVLSSVLQLVDRYDLYGSVAYPKRHRPEDVPDIYRIAAKSGGVFVNPALTEPFGLTLIESAASGLPVVATHDGGPRDILKQLKNGVLIDPNDHPEIGNVLLDALTDRPRWRRWSQSGARLVHEHYSWDSHVQRYVRAVQKVGGAKKFRAPPERSRLPTVTQMLISDIDDTLLGDREALDTFLAMLAPRRRQLGFGVATGRRIESAIKVLKDWGIPTPDVFITAVGSEIYYAGGRVQDLGWHHHIDYRWRPSLIREAMVSIPGVKLQPKEEQRPHKISYFVDSTRAPPIREIRRHLRKLDLHVKLIYSRNRFLDLLPIRASKGLAIRYLGAKWGLAPDRFFVAGDSGNDLEMLSGNTLGIIVGNYSEELESLRGSPRIYFARACNAWGILEGMDYYERLANAGASPSQELEVAER